jgi:hypothetical protein
MMIGFAIFGASLISPLINAPTFDARAVVRKFVKYYKLYRYEAAIADLNDDGRPEAIIYAMSDTTDPGINEFCGSGGCSLYIIAIEAHNYKVISNISLVNVPVSVLKTKSHGWHDLTVRVEGGGIIPGYVARLRFDGRSYPENPTVPPATRAAGLAGRVMIANIPAPPSGRAAK